MSSITTLFQENLKHLLLVQQEHPIPEAKPNER
jgi:hypothetical protein